MTNCLARGPPNVTEGGVVAEGDTDLTGDRKAGGRDVAGRGRDAAGRGRDAAGRRTYDRAAIGVGAVTAGGEERNRQRAEMDASRKYVRRCSGVSTALPDRSAPRGRDADRLDG